MTGRTHTAARRDSEAPDPSSGEGFGSHKGRSSSPNLLQAWTDSDVSPRLWARTRSIMQPCSSAASASVTLHWLEEIWTQAGTSLHVASLKLRQEVFISLRRRNL